MGSADSVFSIPFLIHGLRKKKETVQVSLLLYKVSGKY